MNVVDKKRSDQKTQCLLRITITAVSRNRRSTPIPMQATYETHASYSSQLGKTIISDCNATAPFPTRIPNLPNTLTFFKVRDPNHFFYPSQNQPQSIPPFWRARYVEGTDTYAYPTNKTSTWRLQHRCFSRDTACATTPLRRAYARV